MSPLEVIALPWLLFGLIALGGAVVTTRKLRKPKDWVDQ